MGQQDQAFFDGQRLFDDDGGREAAKGRDDGFVFRIDCSQCRAFGIEDDCFLGLNLCAVAVEDGEAHRDHLRFFLGL